jgi:DNA-binding CsgD family transcriptional regulator
VRAPKARANAMDLALRDATPSDFAQCLALLASPLLCDPARRDALCDFWSEIIRSGAGTAAVAADAVDPTLIIHFGFSVFISDERTQDYRRCTTPLLARRLVEEFAAGGCPFLRGPELARANAEPGLNLLVTHYGRRSGDPRVDIANYESSRRALRGWNLRSFTVECFTESQRDMRAWGKSLGYSVLEYSPDRLRAADIPPNRAPFLLTAARCELAGNTGYGTNLLFLSFSPPRLGLNARQQQLLSLALDGGTDLTIARAAGISEAAVKKHFRMIYDKVSGTGIVDSLAVKRTLEKRGAEARRHLLNYLRDHPEELRPYRLHQ